MHAGRIQGATRALGAPADWDKNSQGPCGTLLVRDEKTTAGEAMVSAWFPTPEEIERMKQGAPIYLTLMGRIHPPVSLCVGKQTMREEHVY